MPVQVVSSAPAKEKTAADEFRERLAKYIPVEIVGGYVALRALLPMFPARPLLYDWLAFALMLAITPVYVWLVRHQEHPDLPPRLGPLVIPSLSFALWGATLGDKPFSSIPGYNPLLGAILLVPYTILVAKLAK